MLNVRTWITVWLWRLMGQDRGVVRGWLSDTESSRMRSPRTGFVQNMSWVCLRTGFVQNMSGGFPGRCTACRITSFYLHSQHYHCSTLLRTLYRLLRHFAADVPDVSNTSCDQNYSLSSNHSEKSLKIYHTSYSHFHDFPRPRPD